ncbi:hypothetical protein AYM40_15600 [Paraburkholderia phytofirmans OLGA172]|uniref:Uncharacterized protein n=1 Tax=Paraburkholderia phytofirmans OLGA172 TaxID=1417228 RepID=A0A160FMC5_9BURK|nr:hypothetical protein [Paraburkholderia phytofirmans]ANB73622.1 hypothetical protein AYM40_15600 [Paraburkholderia phytofirmans OLGA172]
MFLLLEDRKDKERAQRKLEAAFKGIYQTEKQLNLGWMGNNRASDVHTNGQMWYRHELFLDGKVDRWLNWFGYLNSTNGAHITVEVNVPTDNNSQTVSGFFARDPASGRVLLMHDGGLRGGRKGVGKSAYLAWSTHELMEVADSGGNIRAGIIVASLDSRSFQTEIERFVGSVRAFKDAVQDGLLNTEAFRKREREFRKYKREFSGRKRGSRAAEIDYISRHGDIVDALKAWRELTLEHGEEVTNTGYIDLVVIGPRSDVREIFEVKTGCTRGHIYTAIGQLMVHKITTPCAQSIVIPAGDDLPDGLEGALKRLGIRTVRFQLKKKSVEILGYSHQKA